MREYKFYLEDILNSINKINRYLLKIKIDNLFENELILDAVLRNLQIIGEASKNIPSVIKRKYSSVEWRKISGFRDILIHAYFGINNEIVLDIIKNKLPLLKTQIENILKEQSFYN